MMRDAPAQRQRSSPRSWILIGDLPRSDRGIGPCHRMQRPGGGAGTRGAKDRWTEPQINRGDIDDHPNLCR
jgi:hypothetical protein